ncbi:MAG: AAA family ATPase, partial [Angelakisella sp.]
QAATSNVFILTGGPGTGKTTTLNGILSLLEKQGMKVALAAPTGRAAKRMTEVTGREAKTIHRLLEVEPSKETLTFKRNEKNPLPADVIIVDEMSMVDTIILDCLLRGMRLSCKLIMVGDSDQLPSVSAGNILGDMIASDVVPMVHLNRVFRQAAQSLIVTGAHAIVAGEMPDLVTRDSDFFFLRRENSSDAQTLTVDLCARRLPKAYKLSPLWDIQVIVPGKKGPVGTQELNRCLQAAINPPSPKKTEAVFFGRTFREGDKVMQIRNNYDVVCKLPNGEEAMGIFNGDIGIIDMMDISSKTILVRFDDRVAAYTFDNADQLELAYAITVHKSQGSEFEAVVMPLCGKHPKLHYRNLLYTGVTRAKKLLVVTGSPDTVAEMVANNRRTLRYTNLTN